MIGGTATPSGSCSPPNEHYNPTLLNLFASQYWLVNVATYGTILIEIAFPFLIWQERTRPYLLAAALFLHAQFAVLMGLFYFSFVMMMGHMSFVRPEWLTRLGLAWKRTMGDMEMIYDGRCGFCVRSMIWFLAFDGLEPDQDTRFSHQSLARGQRCTNGKGALSGPARRASAAGLRSLSIRRAARAGIVVADSVLLCAGVQPSYRASDIQLDRRKPKLALVYFDQPTAKLSGGLGPS